VLEVHRDVTTFYAHTLDGRPPSSWQLLEDHLRNVADQASVFASRFGAADWGRLAGMWHDVGKYSAAFQTYLRTAAGADPHSGDAAPRTDHSTAGAQHAVRTIDILGHLLAYVIAGHHSGLLDGRSDGACLDSRLAKTVEPWQHGLDRIPALAAPPPTASLQNAFARHDPFPLAFFVRMLLSCLADSDFLDTETFRDPGWAAQRPSYPADILQRMEEFLCTYIDGLRPIDTPVNRRRREVRTACVEAAGQPPGLFSLTVPTGGGKTLSSLAFALRHAVLHKLDRIVYVVPFTSIIEQNAAEFRRVVQPLADDLGLDLVIEHHCDVDVGTETVASRLAAENWDAPLVVTTSVQFYESLFARRTSRCRKLHNLARSVIILDEAQTLPVDFLHPCLRAISELVNSYGATVVLCTATQPAIHRRDGFPIGLEGVREIIPRPAELYDSLKRVQVRHAGDQDDKTLAREILDCPTVLTIVNTRGHARKLFDLIGSDECHFHLSALMCPAHRSRVLREIRGRLDRGLPCRVISTQLIEAGVDIDFPVVFRSLAGLDSIAQAAGRCNRNGRLLERGEFGRVHVFRSEHTRSERFFAETSNVGAQVLELHDDPLTLEAIEHYFRLYYWEQQDRWDKRQVLLDFKLLQDRAFPFSFSFEEAARKFRLIETAGKPVVVPWGDRGRALCMELRRDGSAPTRWLLRALQRFTIEVPERGWDRHVARGDIELVHGRIPLLVSPETHYSETTGLRLDSEPPPFLNV
jgi:CRISPR-associated endonuclease/helicase Cas3